MRKVKTKKLTDKERRALLEKDRRWTKYTLLSGMGAPQSVPAKEVRERAAEFDDKAVGPMFFFIFSRSVYVFQPSEVCWYELENE